MPQAPLPDEIVYETIELVRQHGSVSEAARNSGVSRSCFESRWLVAKDRFPELAAEARGSLFKPSKVPEPEVPLPAADISDEELIQNMKRRFERRYQHHEALMWQRFRVPVDGPYALMFFGDPHIDDNGCNIPLLLEHCELAKETPNLFAVNIGDTTNNWAGKLVRLWRDQSTSDSDAARLAKWFMCKSGVPWWLWLAGNHDMFDGPVSAEYIGAIKPETVQLRAWGAKVTLVSPNGTEIRLWAAHNFKGSSVWNNMHGLERAAQMEDWAHLYVAGHHHDFGIREGENAHRRFLYWLVRVRGYKFVDQHADRHQFPSYRHGAAVVAVIDPSSEGPGRIRCFSDPAEGVEFLEWKRSR